MKYTSACEYKAYYIFVITYRSNHIFIINAFIVTCFCVKVNKRQ